MGIEDEVSSNAARVYKAMKEMGHISEKKMGTAERITQSVRLPKNMVLNALQELRAKGYARRKVREKTAGYDLTRSAGPDPRRKGAPARPRPSRAAGSWIGA